MDHLPPKFGRWLLKKIFSNQYFDEISGDLEELYHERRETKGRFIAGLYYFKDVLFSVRNVSLRRPSVNPGMIRNLVTITFRSLKKRLSYSILNIAGLAASITFALLLWLYVADQTSYDKHYALSDRIYRVNLETNMNGKQDIYSNSPQPVAAALKATYPQIDQTVRIALTEHRGTFEYNNKKIRSENFIVADSTVLQLFNRNFVEGDPSTALNHPSSVVISVSMAQSLFGSLDVLGKVIQLKEYSKDLKVTGVIGDDPHRTHFPFDVVVPWNTFPEFQSDKWYGWHTYMYVLLNKENDVAGLDAQMPAFYERYMKKTFDEFNGKGRIFFQPLNDIYLDSELLWEPHPHGSRTNILALATVALLLIAFAIINYVNLATAQAADRAAEVSIRKTMGSSRRLLWAQFLSESVALSFTSSVLAIGLAWLTLPYFNQLSGIELETYDFFNLLDLKWILLFTIGLGLMAGLFPAFYLSSSPTLGALKGKFAMSPVGEILRRTLVTSQYFIAALLISCILFVYNQVTFIKNKEMGFQRENLINVKVSQDSVVNNHIDVFANDIRNSSSVLSTSLAYVQLHGESDSFTPTLQNEDGSTFQMGCDNMWVDADFIPTIGAEIVTGRNFDKLIPTDVDESVLINEAAVKKFGWDKNPLGGKFAGFSPNDPLTLNIVGIVKDFHLGVSYEQIKPTIIFFSHGGERSLYVRITGHDVSGTIEMMNDAWSKHFPGYEFEYSFVDSDLDALYNRDDNFLSLLASLCGVIIFIASLGIVGLISYTTQLRKKEIAIRKVLGSSLGNIVSILTKKFLVLVIVANVLAVPVTWYLVTWWLSNFAYRIELDPFAFLIPLVICLVFTGLSIFYHTGRAALANPINSLKCE